MSVSEVTTAAAWIAALAIVALIAAGWRKPARAVVPVPRSRRSPVRAVPVDRLPTLPSQRTTWWRRLGAAGASGAIGIVVGMVVGLVAAVAAGWSISTLTSMLRR